MVYSEGMSDSDSCCPEVVKFGGGIAHDLGGDLGAGVAGIYGSIGMVGTGISGSISGNNSARSSSSSSSSSSV